MKYLVDLTENPIQAFDYRDASESTNDLDVNEEKSQISKENFGLLSKNS